jgi:hypothetical protein
VPVNSIESRPPLVSTHGPPLVSTHGPPLVPVSRGHLLCLYPGAGAQEHEQDQGLALRISHRQVSAPCLRLEEIESFHTLGGYRRCRCYSAVRYTIVNRSRRICCREDKAWVAKKTHGTCVHSRVRSMSMGWELVRILLCCQVLSRSCRVCRVILFFHTGRKPIFVKPV